MEKEILKNGFIIINGKAESLPEDLFDTPNKEREDEIIKQITEELKKIIDGKIKNS